MFALVDGNSFYCSCEQVYRPDLRGKPVIVLSNNDGCIVARSKEAKALGIPDLSAYFKVAPLLRKHQVVVFSSNYALYGDLSNRMVTTLRQYAAEVEVYSIDEVFLKAVDCFGDLNTYGQIMRREVWKQVRIPVGVGIASTKTLAKLANRAAKKIPALNSVCVLSQEVQREWLLRKVPIRDIWGIGSRLSERLNAAGIISGWDLANANPKQLRKNFSVNLERTIAELNGVSCLELEEVPTAKKQIFCTRSFGQKTSELEPIIEATATYASRAAEKLRSQNHVAHSIYVFLQTSPFADNYYCKSTTVQLPHPTSDTRIIVRAATQAVTSLYKPGLEFIKSGIGLIDISDRHFTQNDLFLAGQTIATDKLMSAMDVINKKFGRGTIHTAAEGINKKWAMRQSKKSPEYTTRWDQLPKIKTQ